MRNAKIHDLRHNTAKWAKIFIDFMYVFKYNIINNGIVYLPNTRHSYSFFAIIQVENDIYIVKNRVYNVYSEVFKTKRS